MSDGVYVSARSDPPEVFHTDPDCRGCPDDYEIVTDAGIASECKYCKYDGGLAKKVMKMHVND